MRKIATHKFIPSVMFLATTLTALTTLTAFAVETRPVDNRKTVKIGVILPLTGNNAYYGQLCLGGVRFFEHDLKAREAKGELKNHYEIVVEDDQMIGRQTAEALQRLLYLNHVDAIISTSGASGNIVNPRAEQAKILHFGVTSDTKVAKGAYNFTHWTPPTSEAPLLAEILKRKGFKNVAILTGRHQGLMAISDALKDELKKSHIGYQETFFNPGERDFRVMLMKIKETKPDVWVLEAFSPEGDIILRQKKQLGINTEVTSIEMFDLVEEKPLVEGKYFVSGAAERADYIAQMNAFDPKLKPTYSGYFYDSLSLIIDAHEKNPPTASNADLAKWLTTPKDYPSTVGDGKLTVGADHVVRTAAAYYTTKDGKMTPTTLEEILK